ncbi:MAG: hypothetical protein ACM3N7_05390 [Planctomycetaceae bacterium]
MKENFPPVNDLAPRTEEAGRLLRERLRAPFRHSYVGGKTVIRDFLYENLGCSLLEAEEWVDTLETQGEIKFQQDMEEGGLGTWEIS